MPVPKRPTREQVKAVIAEVTNLELSIEECFFQIHDRLGLEYGELWDYVAEDPVFFDDPDPPAPLRT